MFELDFTFETLLLFAKTSINCRNQQTCGQQCIIGTLEYLMEFVSKENKTN